MANTKISGLTDGNPAQSNDLIPIARGGANFSVSAGSISSLTEQVAVVPVSAAQLKDTLANPIVLIPAPGANEVIVPTQIQIGYIFNGTPFSSPTDGAACNGAYNVSGTLITTSSTRDDDAVWAATLATFSGLTSLLKNAAANANTIEYNILTTSDAPLEQIKGLGLLIINEGSEDFNAGNGSLIFTIRYRIITLV